ncbi:hypothetical protein M8J77_026550 [Diaphorina citri]|nr:hypothetical protein M8J77_026550 [Diaphorina citri]
MSSNMSKASFLSKNNFRKSLQQTNVSQENVLSRLQANTNSKHVDSLIEDKYSETLNNLDSNALENTLQNTLHLLNIEYNKLMKVQETTQRDLENLRTVLSQEIKQQRLNYTQSLLANGDNHTVNPVSEQAVLKAQKSIALKLEYSNLTKYLDNLKHSLRPYEDIPPTMEEAQAKVKELEKELKRLELEISSAYCDTSLNESL